jgi:TatD DNase family protein
MARRAIELGLYISFAGTLTFKKADDLRDIARQLPLDRLLVETDCPYLTPVPFRGRRNEPARVVETAKCLGGLREQSLDEIGRITTQNFARLFQIAD